MVRFKLALIVAMALIGGLAGYATLDAQGGKKVQTTRVFELRTYHVVKGRMDAMNARFRDHTCKLLEKHGMTLIGFWQPTGEKHDTQLIYLVAHASKEAADKSWADFRKDPDWIKARDASEKDGKIVNKVDSVYMNPTDYSAIK